MHRAALVDLLKAYHPSAQEEITYKKQMLEFIQNNADCFERTLASGHMTASAWIVSKDGEKALLMNHAKLNMWVQLGGHCDGDSDVLAVAIKETQEESGILNIEPVSRDIFDIDIHLIPENKKEKAHYHYDVRFLLRVASDEQPIQNSESKELRWISKDPNSLPTKSRSVTRMFDKWYALNDALHPRWLTQSE